MFCWNLLIEAYKFTYDNVIYKPTDILLSQII